MTDPTQLDSVREVLQRHKETLMRDYRAAGVGIGKRNLDDAEYAAELGPPPGALGGPGES